MAYGVENVVNSFGRPLTNQEKIAFTVTRTYVEQRHVRSILGSLRKKFFNIMDLGCGYGRMYPLLAEFLMGDKATLVGVERDFDLWNLCCILYPRGVFKKVPEFRKNLGEPQSQDLVFSHTVLQHVKEEEMAELCNEISWITRPGGYIMLCEETDPKVLDAKITGRTALQYQKLFPRCSLDIETERYIEESNANQKQGSYLVFRKN